MSRFVSDRIISGDERERLGIPTVGDGGAVERGRGLDTYSLSDSW